MIFDHGCDAIVAVINSTMLMRLFVVGADPYHLFTMMMAIFPFYFVTLEQHYTGMMNFPPINGVDEGSIVISGLAIFSGYYGNVALWQQEITLPIIGGTYPLNLVLLRLTQASIYPYALQGLYQIYLKRHSEHFKQVYEAKMLFLQIFFYAFSLFTFTYSQIISPTEVWRTHQRTVQMAFGGLIMYIVHRLQYSHIIDQKVNPLRRTVVLTWALIWLNIYWILSHKQPLINEGYLFYLLNVLIWGACLHQAYYLLEEMKTILKINIFLVKQKKVE